MRGCLEGDMTYDPVHIEPYDPAWPQRFALIGAQLRTALGERARRIDHIGSTAVPGLAAKPIIDIQVSVVDFEPFAPLRAAIEALGYGWGDQNPDLTKRFFRDHDPHTVHIHVRIAGSWSEQQALLFRDFLRAHPDVAADYAAIKRELAARYRLDREAYTEAKSDFIWGVYRHANAWSQEIGWFPGPSDV